MSNPHAPFQRQTFKLAAPIACQLENAFLYARSAHERLIADDDTAARVTHRQHVELAQLIAAAEDAVEAVLSFVDQLEAE